MASVSAFRLYLLPGNCGDPIALDVSRASLPAGCSPVRRATWREVAVGDTVVVRGTPCLVKHVLLLEADPMPPGSRYVDSAAGWERAGKTLPRPKPHSYGAFGGSYGKYDVH